VDLDLPGVKAGIDALTENGAKIEAVVATHPFHTLAFPKFFAAYPNLKYYGTPRHLRVLPHLQWAGSVYDEAVRKLWEPEVEMRIPAGAEFVDPQPERSNHFSNVFVYHRASRTVHDDDTIIVLVDVPFLLRLLGFTEGKMYLHTSVKGPGLLPTPEAPIQFKCWLSKLCDDWDFDNFCAAHRGAYSSAARAEPAVCLLSRTCAACAGCVVGGARDAVRKMLADATPMLEKLAKRNAERAAVDGEKGSWSSDPEDKCECG
jgi:hypothetical protein